MSLMNFNVGTSVNNRPNFDIGMTVDPGMMNQAQQAWQGVTGQGGSSWNWGGQQSPMSATTQNVDPNQLMSHQMNSLLDQGGAYMERGRREGEAMASRRGLMNSSIMADSAMGAMVDRAAPIAQFDAGRFGNVADQNMAAQNQAAQINAQIAGQLQGQGMSQRNAMDQAFLGHQFGALDDYRRHMLGLETREDTQSFQAGQSDIDRMINQDQFYRNYGISRDQLQQQDRAMDQGMFQNMFSNYFNTIGAIYNNPNLTGAEQTAQVNNLNQMFPGFANMAWSSIPPGLINPQAQQAAMNLPPMPPMPIGPQPPGG